MLRSILELFPLDTYVEYPVCYMKVVDGDNFTPRIWSTYERVLAMSDENYKIDYLERFEFYERQRNHMQLSLQVRVHNMQILFSRRGGKTV